MPSREIEIGKRLRQTREQLDLSRPQFAARLGIDSARLTTYELGHVPVPYGVADDIAREASVCQRWLAVGSLPLAPYFRISEDLAALIPPRLHFTFVYDRLLSSFIEPCLQSSQLAGFNSSLLEELDPLGTGPHEVGKSDKDHLERSISALLAGLPGELRLELVGTLSDTCTRFIKRHQGAIQRYKENSAQVEQEHREYLAGLVRKTLRS